MLRNKKFLKLVFAFITSLLATVVGFWGILETVWTQLDFQVLDLFFRQAVKTGHTAFPSSQVIYLNITDATYRYFGKNILDRVDLAKINDALAEFDPEAVGYDIIFARPSHPTADSIFTRSLENLGCVYLPIGFELSDEARPFKWETGKAYQRFQTAFLKKPTERGEAQPIYGIRALMQMDDFAEAAFNSGDISAANDPDGVYRHIAMVLKVDSLYFPSLSLAMLLDYAGLTLDDVAIHWGDEIRIPATDESFLEEDVVIPIDQRGRTYIPYAQTWGHDFKQMPVETFLELAQDGNLQGNLSEFFEGSFVFVGDVAIGTSDLGQTPLEDRVPLVAMHASLMNGLLTNTFYRRWTFEEVIALISLIGFLLGLAALSKASRTLYITAGAITFGLIVLTWVQFIHFKLLPLVSVGGSTLFIIFGLIMGLQIAISKDQAFIRSAFSKYVPERVVSQLLTHPDQLKLGGEERELTVLFSDLVGFTTLSENMPPGDLVKLLNDYFTEMTDIILAEGGIIDKFLGDAIMAEFGAPIAMPNHADKAVRAALLMQRRLRELYTMGRLPELKCRTGINTGKMVIGNMGSHLAFDYTVIGDAVNLASRLESANNRYNTSVMISEFTFNQLSSDKFRVRLLDVIKVKGKSKAVKVYEVYGFIDEAIDERELLYYRTYHEAFESYLLRNFDIAHQKFTLALAMHPNDPATKLILARLDALHTAVLADDWDGSISLTSKDGSLQ